MRAFVTKPSVRPAGSLRMAAPSKLSAVSEKKSALPKFEGGDVCPTTAEVEGILNTLVHETDIMEMNLEMGGFVMKVKRSTAGAAAAAPAAAPAAAAAAPASAPAAAQALAPAVDMGKFESTMEESFLVVEAPKVGIFRRGRYAGNKRVGKGNCAEVNDAMKRGQPVGYVEQLGTFVPVECPQAGELVKFDVQDGDAVEYGQTVVQMAPFFGGHIIGDSKHA